MNPILVTIGPLKIYWYSIFILMGILTAYFIIVKEAKRHNISENIIVDLFFVTIPIALIGARIYYCTFEWTNYKDNLIEIFEVWNGGLAIHGGIIAGLVVVYFYTKKKNMNLFKLLDIIVLGLIIGQAIGRWGNFANGEAHGPITSLENIAFLPQFIIDGMYIDGHYYIPTFLYESIWCIIGFIIMFWIRKRDIKIGFLSGFYLIWYGIGRFIIESLRTDSLMFMGLKIAQIVSILMMILGVILIYKGKNKYNEG